MDKTIPQDAVSQGTAPITPHRPPLFYARQSCSDRNIAFALGVVLLVFGPAVTGYHQTSVIGLALIVFCSLI